MYTGKMERVGGGGGRLGGADFFLREFFSRALLSERLEQARLRWLKLLDF